MKSKPLQYVYATLSQLDSDTLTALLNARDMVNQLSIRLRDKHYSAQTTVIDVRLKVLSAIRIILEIRKDLNLKGGEMSWGERSCKKPCRCPDKCKFETCNVNCEYYEWDGTTEPDSEKAAIIEFREASAALHKQLSVPVKFRGPNPTKWGHSFF